MKTAVQSLAIGILVTLGLFGLGYLAVLGDFTTLSYVLYWQGWCMSVFVSCENLGTQATGLCHMIAFYAGIPLGIVVYSSLAFATLFVLKRRVTK